MNIITKILAVLTALEFVYVFYLETVKTDSEKTDRICCRIWKPDSQQIDSSEAGRPGDSCADQLALLKMQHLTYQGGGKQR